MATEAAAKLPELTYKLLVADDDRTTRMLLQAKLEDLGYHVTPAKNGAQAWDFIQETSFDIILLDREMPKLSGLDVVAKLKEDPILKKIPVIMQTGADQPEQIKEGIDAGVYYYLTKPFDNSVLESVLTAATREINQKNALNSELRQHKKSFNLITNCKFTCNTLTDAESLACFLANCFPSPDTVVSGLAALLINAHEHGNLGIGYETKTKLMKQGNWRQEVEKREHLPENQDKKISIEFKREPTGLFLIIEDQGDGFNWPKYLAIDPSRAQDNHGRGIAQANIISFDNITYNEKGNQVTAFVSQEDELDW